MKEEIDTKKIEEALVLLKRELKVVRRSGYPWIAINYVTVEIVFFAKTHDEWAKWVKDNGNPDIYHVRA